MALTIYCSGDDLMIGIMYMTLTLSVAWVDNDGAGSERLLVGVRPVAAVLSDGDAQEAWLDVGDAVRRRQNQQRADDGAAAQVFVQGLFRSPDKQLHLHRKFCSSISSPHRLVSPV
jgi:hypothetical protein